MKVAEYLSARCSKRPSELSRILGEHADLRLSPSLTTIIRRFGQIVNEFNFGPINVSKELQKHVVEFVPCPSYQHPDGECDLDGMMRFHDATGHRCLCLGMHPLLTWTRQGVGPCEDKRYTMLERLRPTATRLVEHPGLAGQRSL